MAQPSYQQFCAVARGLDAVGERWTLLIVRELLLGPQRYTDLLEGLAGASPNVLAERLKKLEELEIVVRRKLPPPAASVVYELTPFGRGLEPVLAELLRWGLNFLTERRAGEAVRLDHVLLAMRSVADPAATVGVHESYEFHVEEHTFHVVAADGSVGVEPGPVPNPAATFTTDLGTLAAIGAGRLPAEQALSEGRLALEGNPHAALRASHILAGHTRPGPGAAPAPEAAARAPAI
jgi:DNA-binding HxlR family transcriptional regulator